MTVSFARIIILYNPISTGTAKADARTLQAQLHDRDPQLKVEVIPTEHPGHASEIGEKYARQNERTLLIMASGDGGYNELVNGVLRAGKSQAVTAVLPSGNANDHSTAMSDQDLAARISKGTTRHIDVISVTATQNDLSWQRYAHSYIGLGLTPYIAHKLAAVEFHPVSEKWLVLKYLTQFRYISARLDGEPRRRYSNILIANIDKMSKIISLDQDSSTTDGYLELYVTRSRSVFSDIVTLLKGSLLRLKKTRSIQEVSIELSRSGKIQLDGEVERLDAGLISIRVEPSRLEVV